MKRIVTGLAAVALVLGLAGTSQALIALPKVPGLPGVKVHHYHVKYRCLVQKKRCFQNHAQAHAFEIRLKSLGFITRMTHQPGKFCVYYRLPVWKQKVFVGPAGHAQAHALQNFLIGLGCQTQLIHH